MAKIERDEQFVPKGAVAFFALMLLSFGLIWLAMYWLMIYRQMTP